MWAPAVSSACQPNRTRSLTHKLLHNTPTVGLPTCTPPTRHHVQTPAPSASHPLFDDPYHPLPTRLPTPPPHILSRTSSPPLPFPSSPTQPTTRPTPPAAARPRSRTSSRAARCARRAARPSAPLWTAPSPHPAAGWTRRRPSAPTWHAARPTASCPQCGENGGRGRRGKGGGEGRGEGRGTLGSGGSCKGREKRRGGSSDG